MSVIVFLNNAFISASLRMKLRGWAGGKKKSPKRFYLSYFFSPFFLTLRILIAQG